MLKALELVGFKSFADRTRFEFPPGITVVVGPNGSGKSNVVDAIKWALGEQSVKSLRGREMADVIFNGSTGRRAMNAAEITLTFDNSKHLLDIDAPEVQITRRVYRSGEGEYLVNRNPARLRDIRDLISGTGMGSQAYSVIEQGKVDILLQSSPRDRRVIFEEAAGISRFKLRKVEAQRRLERVEQNLLRLSDIVDEVESRLRGVRTQAGKARRYKEYADRLQELRTQVGLFDWRRLSDRLAAAEGELQSLNDARNAAAAELERFEAQRLETDNQTNRFNEEIRQTESQIADNREHIATAESTVEHERSRGRDLDQEIARSRRQVVALSTRAGDLQQQLQETADARTAADAARSETAKRLVEAERQLSDVMTALDALRGEHEQRRTAYVQQMRASAALGNEISAMENQTAASAETQTRCQQRMAELEQTFDAVQRELAERRDQRDELADRTQQQSQQLAEAKDQTADAQRRMAAASDELAELRRRESAAAERAAVLEELVRRQEGIGAGVREVLARAADPADSVFHNVHGLVADLFHVSVEAAPLVEIALGPAAQHVVATRTDELLGCLQSQAGRLGSRVGFLWLDAEKPSDAADLEGRPGVLGRGDRFVETEARLLPLARRLLGRTWFVEKLSQAVSLWRAVGGGLTFVTLAGELLEPDGTLTVGPRSIASGLISRRSQLRALASQRSELQTGIAAAEQNVARWNEEIVQRQRQLDRKNAELQETANAAAENRAAVAAAEQRRLQLDRQRTTLDAELQTAAAQHDEAVRRLADAQAKRQTLERGLGEMESDVARLGQQIGQLEERRAAAGRETTEIKVDLAKCEERLRNLQATLRQFEEARQERHKAIDDARQRLVECQQRGEASRRAILQAETEIAELFLRKETFAAKIVELVNQREGLQSLRNEAVAGSQKIQTRLRKLDEKTHTVELAASEVRLERNTLADRMREDYGIELAELEHTFTGQEQQARAAVQQEIEELRHKINNLGNVNLEALDELDQLETRYKTLADQYQDLSSAKASLEKIIDRINVDSRRLFSETLDAVKEHFQTLFRDLFGGGRADILLEENVDILDSGIEIIARPPGKEPRSISLLSGGEKTMTCVALLLAIFRSRPSPFCVLDEVDAALDEANIDRFTQVMKDFTAWTQFIIITHSKKTMTAANTIYGITMQESGVSKQVSVRFEDVSDDGRILKSATDEAA
ncbi:MAG: chromosome segregation protein SMC [Thermoguttaceae bacterium]